MNFDDAFTLYKRRFDNFEDIMHIIRILLTIKIVIRI